MSLGRRPASVELAGVHDRQGAPVLGELQRLLDRVKVQGLAGPDEQEPLLFYAQPQALQQASTTGLGVVHRCNVHSARLQGPFHPVVSVAEGPDALVVEPRNVFGIMYIFPLTGKWHESSRRCGGNLI